MSKVRNWFLAGGLSLSLFLSGCIFTTEKGAIKHAEQAAKNAFTTSEMATNEKVGKISFYLPVGMDSSTQSENNFIITDHDQTYILFVNPLEGTDSELNYQEAKAQEEDSLLLKTFKSDNEFGFIEVDKVKDNTYELQVSVGGIKMTTQTSKDELKADAKMMMEVVRSVKINK